MPQGSSRPTPAELARTCAAQARLATVQTRCRVGTSGASITVTRMRADERGHPILAMDTNSPVIHRMLCQPIVTVLIDGGPLRPPLVLTGRAQQLGIPDRSVDFRIELLAVRFADVRAPMVSLRDYHAAEPDPLVHDAPAILQHLTVGHCAELTACVRAHGLPDANWATPRALDRYGLEFTAVTDNGVTVGRLPFRRPVNRLLDVHAGLRAILTCHCRPGG